ncbi:hypothetical protein WQ54_03985 [Bacillus sp. SA1-12]|uniref:YozQ family protein n=1 Tax=Bacillus sp. SA1-12 TaxID=1455638 RepID=UPI0006269C24|nr:YozQ family protein [Bacillus sp. SA1-12]KKI93405.1 hypothetical protein WQ54_03985 [Bacillus sp. SA1-12]
MDKKPKVDSNQIAGRHYEAEDYKRQDELSEGLATTHEQASDDYMEGTIDANFEENVDHSKGSARKDNQ